MPPFPPTIIWRHRKENLKKCSLRGLETRKDCHFFTYPQETLPNLSQYVLLAVDAPCTLSPQDAHLGIFLIDATWRYAQLMLRCLPLSQHVIKRSLPCHIQTAYPRRQEQIGGLASIEALYLAYQILGRNSEGLLDNYYWKENFLQQNFK